MEPQIEVAVMTCVVLMLSLTVPLNCSLTVSFCNP